MQHKEKCLICELRPRKRGSLYCNNCCQQLTADKQQTKTVKPEVYLTWRDATVGLYPTGKDTYRPRLLLVTKIPKRAKLIDLNVWQEGYSREQVKNFKRCIQTLARV